MKKMLEVWEEAEGEGGKRDDKKCCVVNEPKGNNGEGVKSGDKAAGIKEEKGGV